MIGWERLLAMSHWSTCAEWSLSLCPSKSTLHPSPPLLLMQVLGSDLYEWLQQAPLSSDFWLDSINGQCSRNSDFTQSCLFVFKGNRRTHLCHAASHWRRLKAERTCDWGFAIWTSGWQWLCSSPKGHSSYGVPSQQLSLESGGYFFPNSSGLESQWFPTLANFTSPCGFLWTLPLALWILVHLYSTLLTQTLFQCSIVFPPEPQSIWGPGEKTQKEFLLMVRE